MKVASVQPAILPFVQQEQEPKQKKQSFFREAIQPFERLGFEKSFILISHSLLTFFMGCLAGSSK